ncbi:hypothetical protein QBC35DRAFT_470410 [Podospora australis]|uniref:DUF7053 domain-containing protein n=1 Tax=Podospora australis TaxID=1536484 RepID=A0AAN6X0N5_9PEZI|nr:hypothetical protein QBC35DRAFT_470410 [Podospora australis]
MGLLTGTTTITHTYSPTPGTTRAIALAVLSDYEFFLQCNPVHDKSQIIQPPSPPELPEAIKSRLRTPDTKTVVYQVIDVLHALPAGIWDTSVASTYEFTNLDNGVFLRIKAPLGVILDTVWAVREDPETGMVEIVDDNTITCNRMLIGVMRKECEGGAEKMMPKILARMAEDVEKAGKSKGEVVT